MHQMFSYFGSKKRIAKYYPIPHNKVIIEPFAGAAGYSVYHEPDKAILFDIDKNIVKCWEFIIMSGRNNGDPIRDLPLIKYGEKVPDIEGKELIGFWCRRGSDSPRNTLGSWAIKYPNRFWGEYQRDRLANDSKKCANWEIHLSDFSLSDSIYGTWFIDPPYFHAGKHYKHPFSDYEKLAEFSKRQKNQVIVCEEMRNNEMPLWMEFNILAANHLTINKRKAQEVIWTNI